jgi:hypothetical protein
VINRGAAQHFALAALGADGKGLIVINGQPMRVQWSHRSHETDGPFNKITLELSVIDMLDEQQQKVKIGQLEAQLANEKEKLEGIQTLLRDEGWVTKGDD